MMLMYQRSRMRKRRWRKSEPPAIFLSSLEGIGTVRNYLIKLDVHDNTVAAFSALRTRHTGFSRK
jgi:hypothetical protein